MLTKAEKIRIEAIAKHVIDEENSWGDMDVIYLGVPDFSALQEVGAEQGEDVVEERIHRFATNLSFSNPPLLNQTTEFRVTVTLSPNIEEVAYNTRIQLLLPSAFEIVRGSRHGEFGTLSKNDTIQHEVQIRTLKTGDWKVGALVESEGFLEEMYYIYVSVFEANATVSSVPFRSNSIQTSEELV